MRKVLIVVDMQNDFIDGSLGTPEPRAMVAAAAERQTSFALFASCRLSFARVAAAAASAINSDTPLT